jgi:hypothetical protein
MSKVISQLGASLTKYSHYILKNNFTLNRDGEDLKSDRDHEKINCLNYIEYGTRFNSNSTTSVDNRINYEEKYSECFKFEMSFLKSLLGLHQKVIAPCTNIKLGKYEKACVIPICLKTQESIDDCDKTYTNNETTKVSIKGCILNSYQDTFIV